MTVTYIAHRARGFSYPENSLAAVKAALQAGVKEIEIDLRATKDNIMVLRHNTLLDKGTTGKGHVADWTFAAVKKIRLKNKETITHEPIASVEEVLSYFKKYKKRTLLNLDIKDYGLEKELVKMIEKKGLVKHIAIVSWLPQVLKKIYTINPKIKLALSYIPLHGLGKIHIAMKKAWSERRVLIEINSYDKPIPQGTEKGYFHMHYISNIPNIKGLQAVNIPTWAATRTLISNLTKKKIRVNVFSVNKTEKVEKYLQKGVEGIFTDNVLTLDPALRN
jgi:glycerophosphoryl diester phosphodiesterase